MERSDDFGERGVQVRRAVPAEQVLRQGGVDSLALIRGQTRHLADSAAFLFEDLLKPVDFRGDPKVQAKLPQSSSQTVSR